MAAVGTEFVITVARLSTLRAETGSLCRYTTGGRRRGRGRRGLVAGVYHLLPAACHGCLNIIVPGRDRFLTQARHGGFDVAGSLCPLARRPQRVQCLEKARCFCQVFLA